MEAELRDTLKDIRDSIKESTARLEGKIDLQNQQFNEHLVADARSFKGLEMETNAIHTRRRSDRVMMWAAIIGAGITALGALIADIVRHWK